MKDISTLIAANIASLAFLVFCVWCLNNNHTGFAIAGFIVAAFGAATLKSKE